MLARREFYGAILANKTRKLAACPASSETCRRSPRSILQATKNLKPEAYARRASLAATRMYLRGNSLGLELCYNKSSTPSPPIGGPFWHMCPPSISPRTGQTVCTPLVVQGDRGQLDTPRQIATNILPCLGVVWVIPLPGVQVGHPRLELRNVAVKHDTTHPLGDIVAELLYLFADVAQECVA